MGIANANRQKRCDFGALSSRPFPVYVLNLLALGGREQ